MVVIVLFILIVMNIDCIIFVCVCLYFRPETIARTNNDAIEKVTAETIILEKGRNGTVR